MTGLSCGLGLYPAGHGAGSARARPATSRMTVSSRAEADRQARDGVPAPPFQCGAAVVPSHGFWASRRPSASRGGPQLPPPGASSCRPGWGDSRVGGRAGAASFADPRSRFTTPRELRQSSYCRGRELPRAARGGPPNLCGSSGKRGGTGGLARPGLRPLGELLGAGSLERLAGWCYPNRPGCCQAAAPKPTEPDAVRTWALPQDAVGGDPEVSDHRSVPYFHRLVGYLGAAGQLGPEW